jgi:hypothetical protein
LTLYEFNLLERDEKLKSVWEYGVFIDNYVTTKERCNLYAIDKFFVEVELHPETNQIIKINSFKTGYLLDKYSNLKL